jgi:endogenous inhibitor of DNA gyrase (YacG/DUF329 family)
MICPICKKTVAEIEGEKVPKWFPFCSERCKLVDLGRWLDGKYQIPVEITPEDEEANNE